MGLETRVLEQTELDFDPIKPGRVGRQPRDLEAEQSFKHLFLIRSHLVTSLGQNELTQQCKIVWRTR